MRGSDATGRALRLLAVVGLAFGLASVPPSLAQVKKDDAVREQVRRLQQALRKSETEKAEALREKQVLGEKVEALGEAARKEKEAADRSSGRARVEARRASELETALRATRAEAEQLRGEKAALEETLMLRRRELADSAAQLKTQAATLESREDQTKRLVSRTTAQEKRIMACEAANATLHDIGLQCLARFEKEALPSSEPFTQLKRVELENLIEQYRDRMDEQRWARSPREVR